MIQLFFNIEADDIGEKKPSNATFAYNYFQNGVIRLTNGIVRKIQPIPLISKHPHLMKQALGQHPVIFLNFVKVLFDRDLAFFPKELTDTFKPYLTIFNRIISTNETSSDLRIHAERCKEIIFDSASIAPEVLISSVQTLSEVLYTYYGKKSDNTG